MEKSKHWSLEQIRRQEEYGYRLAKEGELSPFKLETGDTEAGIELSKAGQRGYDLASITPLA